MIEKKQKQIFFVKFTLLLTAAAAGCVMLFWLYVNYMLGPMATAQNEILDSITGLDVIIISAALGFAYCIINFSRLRELDKSKLLEKSPSEFDTKTSQFFYASQGILAANVFTLLFWLAYTSVCELTQYQAADGSFQDFTFLNRIWLILMAVAAACSFLNFTAAKTLSKKEFSSRRS